MPNDIFLAGDVAMDIGRCITIRFEILHEFVERGPQRVSRQLNRVCRVSEFFQRLDMNYPVSVGLKKSLDGVSDERDGVIPLRTLI